MNIQDDWKEILKEEWNKNYFQTLRQWVNEQYEKTTVCPPKEDIFNALRYTSYQNTTVLILGQDPYPSPGFAHGLAFSVNPGIKIPKSLQNIYKELKDDLGSAFEILDHGSLIGWSQQGVVLLNTVLTVEAGKANSHQGKGWETFTDKIISQVNEKEQPVVFILWGNNARSKKRLITRPHHLVLESPHPSPLSAYRGFFGSKPFSKTNEFLIKNGLEPIDWMRRMIIDI